MTNQDRERQDFPDDATETRLQVDPMLRPGRVPWAWTIAAAAALVAIAVVLFATNRDDSDVVEAPAVETPVTTGAGPEPPTKQGTAGAPAERGTTGSGQ